MATTDTKQIKVSFKDGVKGTKPKIVRKIAIENIDKYSAKQASKGRKHITFIAEPDSDEDNNIEDKQNNIIDDIPKEEPKEPINNISTTNTATAIVDLFVPNSLIEKTDPMIEEENKTQQLLLEIQRYKAEIENNAKIEKQRQVKKDNKLKVAKEKEENDLKIKREMELQLQTKQEQKQGNIESKQNIAKFEQQKVEEGNNLDNNEIKTDYWNDAIQTGSGILGLIGLSLIPR